MSLLDISSYWKCLDYKRQNHIQNYINSIIVAVTVQKYHV